MGRWGKWKKLLSLLVPSLVLSGTFVIAATNEIYAQPNASSDSGASLTNAKLNSSVSSSTFQFPDSPGAVSRPQPAALELASNQTSPVTTTQPSQGSEQNQTASATAQNAPSHVTQTPVGTAAAPAIPANGIAASQPAGVAIAPAKQRRVRTIVLRVGAIVGAGVAVGTVVALTEATSSKPPGAH